MKEENRGKVKVEKGGENKEERGKEDERLDEGAARRVRCSTAWSKNIDARKGKNEGCRSRLT